MKSLYLVGSSTTRLSSLGPPCMWLWSLEEGEPRDCLCMILLTVRHSCKTDGEGEKQSQSTEAMKRESPGFIFWVRNLFIYLLIKKNTGPSTE